MKKNKKRIVLDCNGVCLNFYLHACNHIEDLDYSQNIDFYEHKKITELLKHKKNNLFFWSTIPNLDYSENINFEIVGYLTHIDESLKDARKCNLNGYGFPNKPIYTVEKSSDKLQWCIDNKIDYLIDDKPTTVKQFLEDGRVNIIRYVPEYYKGVNFNLPPHNEITSLREVKNIIENEN